MTATGSLQPLYTQCPQCYTLFRIDRRHLQLAAGTVRCGHCRKRFDAGSQVTRTLPSDLPARERRDSVTSQPPGSQAKWPEPAARGRSGVDEASTSQWRRVTALDLEQPPQSTGRRWPARLLWGIASALLALLLAGQLVWKQREWLAQDPRWRPWLVQACALAGCEVALPRWPERVRIVRRSLREAPQRPDALRFTATVVNTAAERQAWPQLGLTLKARNGRVVAQSWFAARQYLADETMAAQPMPPDVGVRVRLTIRDPGPGADNFEIGFR